MEEFLVRKVTANDVIQQFDYIQGWDWIFWEKVDTGETKGEIAYINIYFDPEDPNVMITEDNLKCIKQAESVERTVWIDEDVIRDYAEKLGKIKTFDDEAYKNGIFISDCEICCDIIREILIAYVTENAPEIADEINKEVSKYLRLPEMQPKDTSAARDQAKPKEPERDM